MAKQIFKTTISQFDALTKAQQKWMQAQFDVQTESGTHIPMEEDRIASGWTRTESGKWRTPAQAAATEKFFENRMTAEEWAEKRANFKASDALVDALKKKPEMTRKEAKAFGFVGNKDDLKALKRTIGVR